ncbi:MAG: DNA repair protein [Burkholderiales bacterium]|nr:DNA repair protein [Burkholderiales bacterium]
MRPLSLTLKGFRGIRDGLGRDVIELDFEQLAGDAKLVAIIGKNGRGKTTLMDNMTPFPTMPSRAGADGLGSFSYYDQVCLPESVKDLVWEHAGERYRSQLVFRLNGKRKTEAFLHVRRGELWQPVRLENGTVSDGRVETYLACVEHILGSAETFFTSVFAAQGRRPLSAYRNGEIKALLAELLALDEIRDLGAKAAETAKLVKTGLAAVRQERTGLAVEAEQVARQLAQLGDTTARVAAAQSAKAAGQAALDRAKAELAKHVAMRDVALQTEARRSQLAGERGAAIEARKAALCALDAQDRREAERLQELDRRIRQRTEEARKRRKELDGQRVRLEATLKVGGAIERAAQRLPWAQSVAVQREQHVAGLRRVAERLDRLTADGKLAREQVAGIEREAGQASLRVQELTRRFGLTAEVPCAGTDLQGRCKLLSDAREAQSLRPDADARVARLQEERARVALHLQNIEAQRESLAAAHEKLRIAEARLRRSRERSSVLSMRAARQGELAQAGETLARIVQQIESLPQRAGDDTAQEKAERAAIAAARQAIGAQREGEAQRQRESLRRIDAALAALPAPFDASRIERAERSVEEAQLALVTTEATYLKAVRDQDAGEELRRRKGMIGERLSTLDRRMRYIEDQVGTWALFAKCLSNDGLIALSIDDAGPALSCLANDLLLACYGPRFTVSLKTLVETAKGEAREGFDIVVHDAESGEAKSVTQMSAGERVWINESLTRAIALYLTQNSGRHYETLFSDEADGPLDPERKRMFMAMKREVLRIGGYRQEFFVSQTPELAAMADVIINLEHFR